MIICLIIGYLFNLGFWNMDYYFIIYKLLTN